MNISDRETLNFRHVGISHGGSYKCEAIWSDPDHTQNDTYMLDVAGKTLNFKESIEKLLFENMI